jgi:hypothetical protein
VQRREIFVAGMASFAAEIADWASAERMLRAGVRFGMVEAILCDIYPSAMNGVQPAP